MRRKKILYAAMIITVLSTISAGKIYAASTEIPNGTVVIGAKAFDLSYANDSKNLKEITSAIVASGEVYVKGFDAIWIDNNTFKTISPSVIPSVTYKSSTGAESKYAGENKTEEKVEENVEAPTNTLEVTSIN